MKLVFLSIVLVVTFARGLSSESQVNYPVDPSIAGVWYNELGSRMDIYDMSAVMGEFSGLYHTIVGVACRKYPVVGRYDTTGNETHGTVGFTVQWQNYYLNSNSTTTWCGQRLLLDRGPTITTTWLLTRATTPADAWGATQIGKDIFTRSPQQEISDSSYGRHVAKNCTI